MSAIDYDTRDDDWDLHDEDDEQSRLTRRPRRQFFNRRSAALIALVTCAAGFYAGVRVEKSQLGGTQSSAGLSLPAALGGNSTSRSSGGAGASSGSGSRGGFPGGGTPFASGNASFGTVSSVSGNTIYMTDSSGNTVKVTLSSATKLTKTVTVDKAAVRPGDTVVVQGLKNKSGTLAATSLSDSGASSSGGGSGSSSSGSSAAGGGGGSSAVNSLFGAGNGG